MPILWQCYCSNAELDQDSKCPVCGWDGHGGDLAYIELLREKLDQTERELLRERAEHEGTRTQLDRIMHAHVLAGFCTEELLCDCACKQCVHIARSMEEGGYLEPGAGDRVEAVHAERFGHKENT